MSDIDTLLKQSEEMFSAFGHSVRLLEKYSENNEFESEPETPIRIVPRARRVTREFNEVTTKNGFKALDLK